MKIPFLKKILKPKTKIPEEIFAEEPIRLTDIVAPSFIEVKQNYIKIGERFAKSYFIFSYPRYLSMGWLSPIINLNVPMDISFFLHPVPSEKILRQLRKRVTEVQAEISEREEKGLIRDPAIETAYQDIEDLRDKLQTAQERMFRFGLYLTIYSNSEKKLREIETNLRSILESRLIYIKPALYQQKEGFTCTSPYNLDLLSVNTLMNTAPLSSTFPFISFDLSSNEGIFYGINTHNDSLVLFDRFTLANANEVIFATSGAGKSYAVKLEILRYLMLEVDSIIIDPENEYKFLAEAVGGSFFNISLSSSHHINPFDLPPPREDEKPEDVLRTNIINLVGLMRIILGGLSPEEDGIMDIALTETYAAKDITPATDPGKWEENIPLMSDMESVLETMEGGESLVRRLRKFTQGTFANFFNQPSNLSLDKNLVVFGIRDMEDELRPMAMFVVMRYIWNKIRSQMKKRMLLIDEAWWLMQSDDGASFLFGVAKRARKYWLGVTTITQDVDDFLQSAYGTAIVANSSLQLLLKQSPSVIDAVQKTFSLTEEEKMLLVESGIGEGVFIAGQKHVAIRVVASYAEDQIITTSPEEVLKIKKAKLEEGE